MTATGEEISKGIRVALSIVSIGLAIVPAVALLGFAFDHERFVFGTEVGGIQYFTVYHYLGMNAAVVGLAPLVVLARNTILKGFELMLQVLIIVASLVL